MNYHILWEISCISLNWSNNEIHFIQQRIMVDIDEHNRKNFHKFFGKKKGIEEQEH